MTEDLRGNELTGATANSCSEPNDNSPDNNTTKRPCSNPYCSPYTMPGSMAGLDAARHEYELDALKAYRGGAMSTTQLSNAVRLLLNGTWSEKEQVKRLLLSESFREYFALNCDYPTAKDWFEATFPPLYKATDIVLMKPGGKEPWGSWGGYKRDESHYQPLELIWYWRLQDQQLAWAIPPGFLIIDADVGTDKNGKELFGFESLNRFLDAHPAFTPCEFKRVRTPRGGEHRYYRLPQKYQPGSGTHEELRALHGKIIGKDTTRYPNLDIKKWGGYCLIPPSGKLKNVAKPGEPERLEMVRYTDITGGAN